MGRAASVPAHHREGVLGALAGDDVEVGLLQDRRGEIADGFVVLDHDGDRNGGDGAFAARSRGVSPAARRFPRRDTSHPDAASVRSGLTRATISGDPGPAFRVGRVRRINELFTLQGRMLRR
jgi:hypothetical protein